MTDEKTEHKDAVSVWIDVNDNFVSGFAHRHEFKNVAARKGRPNIIDVYSHQRMTPDCLIASKPTPEVFRTNPPEMLNAPDMTVLTFLEEPNMLHCLELRHKAEEIYTKIAGVLVAINPYHSIPCYTLERMISYRGSKRLDLLPPHIFGIGEMAYQEMTFRKANQSMICCGESGSGKTESTKWLMRYLANVSVKKDDVEQKAVKTSIVEQQVLEANPVLEAFGNAKTLMNDNSSRFAKFTKLFFSNDEGRIVGAHTLTYLLEKSRVVQPNRGERNFHVFYQLCAGIESRRKATGKEGFLLPPVTDFKYASRSGCLTLDGVSDEEMFTILQHSMEKMGISSDDQEECFRIVAAILYLGNIEFCDSKTVTEGSEVDPSSLKHVQKFAELLDLKDLDVVKKRFLIRNIQVKNNENYEKNLTPQEADDNRDAMAKALYNELFLWIVTRINQTLFLGDTSGLNWIGILDVFGFECFQHNSFEQFCINFANEKLQEFFNDHIIKGEQREYRKEGIFWVPVDLPDNLDCIKLIDSKPSGILCLLDSACIMPKGNHETFRDNLFNVHKFHPRLSKPPAGYKPSLESMMLGLHKSPMKSMKMRFVGFSVRHYAGNVTYDCAKFLEKNTDRNHPETILLFSSSESKLLTGLFAEQAAELKRERRNRFNSLGSTFSRQLESLMQTLRETTPYFIRCVSPNNKKSATEYMWNYVKPQLRCGGLVQALKLLKCGYPNRFKYEEILKHYADALKPRPVNLNIRDYCEAVLVAFGCEREEYQLGLNKVFFKAGKREFLEDIFKRSDKPLSPEMEAKIRAWLVKKRVVRMKGTIRSYLYINERLRHIRAFRNFRAAVFRGMIYLQTFARMMTRVRKRQAAKKNAISFLQAAIRHNTKRRALQKFIGGNARKRRQNKFFQPQVDAKTKEELNKLKIMMASAQKKAESSQKAIEQIKAEAAEKEVQLRQTIEQKKQEFDALQVQLEELRAKEKAADEQSEVVENLKKETEKMRLEREQLEKEAKAQIAHSEREYKAKQLELEKIRLQREEMARQMESEKKRLEREREEERRSKEEELKRLEEETKNIKELNEKKALEAQRLLHEREEENKQKEAYLAKITADAERLKAQHKEETEQMRLEREAEHNKKEEEFKQFKEQTEKMRKELEGAAEAERKKLIDREEENKKRERDLLESKEREERLRKEHEDRARRLEEEREAEKRKREEELVRLREEAEKTKKEQEERAQEALRLLKEKEEENKKKQANLMELQLEAEKDRRENEQRLVEAKRQLELKEHESQLQMEKARKEAEDASKKFGEAEQKLREETQEALERQLKQREAEQQSQIERMKQIQERAIALLEEQIRIRDDEIARLKREAQKKQEDHEEELDVLRRQLKVAQEHVIQKDSQIAALEKEIIGMRKAHKDLNDYSEQLIKEAEEDKASLTKQLKATKEELSHVQAHAKEEEEKQKKLLAESQEENQKKIKALTGEVEEQEARFKRKLKVLEDEMEDTLKRRIKTKEEEIEFRATALKSASAEAVDTFQRQLSERTEELKSKDFAIGSLKQDLKEQKTAHDQELAKLSDERDAKQAEDAKEIAKLNETIAKSGQENQRLTTELSTQEATAAEYRLKIGNLEKKLQQQIESGRLKLEEEQDATARLLAEKKVQEEKTKSDHEKALEAAQKELADTKEAAAKLRAEREKEWEEKLKKLSEENAKKLAETEEILRLVKKDHADLVHAYRDNLQQGKKSERKEDPLKYARQSSLMELTKANLLLQRTADDFIKQLKRREGYMLKRRPKGAGGFAQGQSDKERYIVLEGVTLSWYAQRPNSLSKKATKPLGSLNLVDYKLIPYNENHEALAVEGKETKFDIETMSKSLKYTGDPRDYVLRLHSKKGRNAREMHLLMLPDQSKPGCVNDILDWVEDLNRRICLADYLAIMFKKKNEVSTGMSGCREVVEFLCDPSAQELSITDKVTDIHEALCRMKEALRTRKDLKRIVFKNVALADQSVLELAQIVGHNQNLIELQLPNNNISFVGAEALSTAFHTNLSLCTLDLSYNQLGSKGLMMLASALPVHTMLNKIVLVGNKISDEGIVAFVEWMLHGEDPDHPHPLPEIELAENLVGAKGCEALANLLSKNPTITRVDLTSNLVDDDGAGAFAELLKSGKSKMRELNLGNNHISSKGASAIAEALKLANQDLTVDMSGNKLITRQGVADVIASKGDLEFVLFKVKVSELSAEGTPVKKVSVAVDDTKLLRAGPTTPSNKNHPSPRESLPPNLGSSFRGLDGSGRGLSNSGRGLSLLNLKPSTPRAGDKDKAK